MKPRAAFAIAFLLIVWLAAALAQAENERYALSIGMCWNPTEQIADMKCLRSVETRTGWWWHIFYGLTAVNRG